MSFANGKFGRLTIRKEICPNVFVCDCACGNEVEVWRSLLAGNIQRDCGCVRPRTSVHGHTRTVRTRDGRTLSRKSREYYSWSNMVGRCYNENHHAFADYGGRGIRVCERWLPDGTGQGFKNFLADMGPRPLDKTLDRKNPQGHYCPDNCQWADWDAQGRNKRLHLWPEDGPEKMPPVESCREMEARIRADFAEMNPF